MANDTSTSQALQNAARKCLTSPPVFTREDGTQIPASDVPDQTRQPLESIRQKFLEQIANSPDFASRADKAIHSRDTDGILALAREIGLRGEMKIRILSLPPPDPSTTADKVPFGPVSDIPGPVTLIGIVETVGYSFVGLGIVETVG